MFGDLFCCLHESIFIFLSRVFFVTRFVCFLLYECRVTACVLLYFCNFNVFLSNFNEFSQFMLKLLYFCLIFYDFLLIFYFCFCFSCFMIFHNFKLNFVILSTLIFEILVAQFFIRQVHLLMIGLHQAHFWFCLIGRLSC